MSWLSCHPPLSYNINPGIGSPGFTSWVVATRAPRGWDIGRGAGAERVVQHITIQYKRYKVTPRSIPSISLFVALESVLMLCTNQPSQCHRGVWYRGRLGRPPLPRGSRSPTAMRPYNASRLIVFGLEHPSAAPLAWLRWLCLAVYGQTL